MSADSWAVRWVMVLAQLETSLAEGERLVAEGRVEEFRALEVPVLAAGLPAELADRARSLQERTAALTARVAEAMAVTRRDLERTAAELAQRPHRTERPLGRQWQPAYVDARA